MKPGVLLSHCSLKNYDSKQMCNSRKINRHAKAQLLKSRLYSLQRRDVSKGPVVYRKKFRIKLGWTTIRNNKLCYYILE